MTILQNQTPPAIKQLAAFRIKQTSITQITITAAPRG